MSDLHLWVQAGSDKGETTSVSVKSTDTLDKSTPVDCTDEEFRTMEASLYQVLHRTTANEPTKKSHFNKRRDREDSKHGSRSR